MRRGIRLGVAVCLTFLMIASIAEAWEFRMKGEFEYRLRYWSRTGTLDLFGDQSIQDYLSLGPGGSGTFIGFAGPSVYRRGAAESVAGPDAFQSNVRITRGGFSRWGSDAHVTDMRLTLYPAIKVNNAIDVYAVMTFGGFRQRYAMSEKDGSLFSNYNFIGTGQPAWWFEPGYNFITGLNRNILYPNLMPGVPPYERYYMSQTVDGAYATASLISVEQIKAVIQLPIGVLAFGTKNFPIGVGATYGRNTREESIYFVVPYGPLAFHAYIFPNQQIRGRNGFVVLPLWWMAPDADFQASSFVGSVVTYNQGPLEIGAGGFWEAAHLPSGIMANQGNLDVWWTQGLLWTKYFNGRFFFNAEYAWENSEGRKTARAPADTSPPVRHAEMYHAFLETGAVVGPAKLSLVWAQSSGPVLNNNNPTKVRWALPINYQAMEPYNYLMFQSYFGGNNVLNADGTGEMGDAYAYAGRFDYAMASNLNLWASYIWAHRLERAGIFGGMYGTADNVATAAVRNAFGPGVRVSTDVFGYGSYGSETPGEAQAWKAANLGGNAADYNPYVDDGFIGWELGLGLDWKLLEGLTVRSRYSYWKLGPYFDQANKAFTDAPQGSTGYGGNGILYGKSAIQAAEVSFMIEF